MLASDILEPSQGLRLESGSTVRPHLLYVLKEHGWGLHRLTFGRFCRAADVVVMGLVEGAGNRTPTAFDIVVLKDGKTYFADYFSHSGFGAFRRPARQSPRLTAMFSGVEEELFSAGSTTSRDLLASLLVLVMFGARRYRHSSCDFL